MNAITDAAFFAPIDRALDAEDAAADEIQIESTLAAPEGPAIPVTVELDSAGDAVAVQIAGVWVDAFVFSDEQRADWAAEYARQLQREAA